MRMLSYAIFSYFVAVYA